MLFTPFVFEHPGPLCGAIRTLLNISRPDHEITTKGIAAQCGVSPEYIQQFERAERLLSHKVLNPYIDALNLPPSNAMRLLLLCNSYRDCDRLEEALGFCTPELIMDHPTLRTATQLLRQFAYPAVLLDPLFFVPVMNDLYRALYDLDSRSLLNPFMWHLISAEFSPGSPIRKAQLSLYGPVNYHLLRLFNQATVPYFFAQQTLELQKSLLFLSPHEYGMLWRSWLLMMQPDNEDLPIQVLQRQGKITLWKANLQEQTLVAVGNGHQLLYRILIFEPANKDAQIVHDDMVSRVNSTLFFAHDHGADEYGTVGVNAHCTKLNKGIAVLN